MCSHAGTVTFASPSPRVMLGGQPAIVMTDPSPVAGCPYVTAGAPTPCVKIQWVAAATRVMIGGAPALLQNATGIGVPNGTPPNIVVTQVKVTGQ